ncbi:LPXTG cell wall anchor domain-containing protein [Fructilactobacillus ixorae]|uniref:LPXTG cell wall anchor domain-containing protein n=1 Tax=Fructilactobacillus ixorae TaxID=1750535 RepID=A0ABY5C4Z4_9LACO|nr:LPXTG cell wall anchor domain-containing protein [Fructilactobacillus ixorae]USS93195.1 LPXTG cell wall anchor domain-containing protein [Fructilactobacillus ixorae]
MSASSSLSTSASDFISASLGNHGSMTVNSMSEAARVSNGNGTVLNQNATEEKQKQPSSKQQKLPQTGSDQQNLTLLGLLTMFLAGLGIKRRKRDEK